MRWRYFWLCLAIVAVCPIPGVAHAAMYAAPAAGSDLIGQRRHIETDAEDTFVALARRYDVGYQELRLANPDVDPWLPGQDTPLLVPSRYILPDAPREGIVINIPEMRLYYYPPADGDYAGQVVTYPLGIGRAGWSTPLGDTRIVAKKAQPSWTPPASIRREHARAGDPLPRVVPAGPDNPLGRYALYLGWRAYLIHGTNKPAGIGLKVSHGCIRLFPADIAALYALVADGTPVTIVSQPYKVGWDHKTLYIEAHPPDADGQTPVHAYTPWVEKLIAATASYGYAPVDWDRAQRAAGQPRGLPEAIGVRIDPR